MLKSYRLRIFLLPALLAGFGMSIQAQQHYYMTATQATDYALNHVTDLKNLKIDRKIQDAQNREITGQAMPQVTGTVSSQHFFTIPVTLLPDFVSPSVYGVLEKEGVQNGSGNPITKPNEPTQFFPAQFGVPWQASAGFAFQQLLYSGSQPAVLLYRTCNCRRMKESQYTDLGMYRCEPVQIHPKYCHRQNPSATLRN